MLSEEKIRSNLSAAWAGCEIVCLETADSTNRCARQWAQKGAKHGALVVAETQTAGRGRRGRNWISPAGEGIFMSLILRPAFEPSRAASLSLCTALATARALERVTQLDCKIKWPNDIVCKGKKVCGMLLEMDADADGVRSVIAGVGINVHQRAFPPEIEDTASSVDLLAGRRISRASVIRAFLEEMETALALECGALMEAYRARSATLSKRVQVIAPTETYTGTALEVTDSGALIVQSDAGERREVLAGDVSVRGIMGYV